MAIKYTKMTNYGVEATFYQVTNIYFDFYQKEAVFNFEGFADECAAKDGKWALDWVEYRISFKGIKADELIRVAEAGSLLDMFKGGCPVDDVDRQVVYGEGEGPNSRSAG